MEEDALIKSVGRVKEAIEECETRIREKTLSTEEELKACILGALEGAEEKVEEESGTEGEAAEQAAEE